jgi:TetR/AcrR family transcriptional repressor of nem operon
MQAKSGNSEKFHSEATADVILDVAQELLQTRGYNAISYQDIADRVGIRKASIHHHFSTKTELGMTLVRRYRRRWKAFLDEIDQADPDVWTKLDRYIEPFGATARTGDRACLCGVLGAEFVSLSTPVQREVRNFFADNEIWLTDLFSAGRKSGQFRFPGPPASAAAAFFSCL